MTEPVRWAFLSFFVFAMTLSWPRMRPVSACAVCALMLVCALVSPASARQQSSSSDPAAAKQPAAKSTTTAHRRTRKKRTTVGKSSEHSATSAKTYTASTRRRSARKKSVRARGQQKIDSERAHAIQEALIREHYLTGEPTGTWNQASEDAMRRYQSDHGWQTKEVPDSRALIKLGLGPSNDHLLNPESAMTTQPDPPKPASQPTALHRTSATADPTPESSSPASPAPASGTSSSPTSTSPPAQSDPAKPQ